LPITADTYNYSKNVPRRGMGDDADTLMELCDELNYNVYTYGGMVLQLEPDRYILSTSRWFVSFTELNNGRQLFHEASGNGYVFNSERDPEAFKHFLVKLQENVPDWKVI
jgi:hypothetical protein